MNKPMKVRITMYSHKSNSQVVEIGRNQIEQIDRVIYMKKNPLMLMTSMLIKMVHLMETKIHFKRKNNCLPTGENRQTNAISSLAVIHLKVTERVQLASQAKKDHHLLLSVKMISMMKTRVQCIKLIKTKVRKIVIRNKKVK